MSGVEELIGDFKKNYGEDIGGLGKIIPELPRIPSGWFSLDLALGGGIPMGKASEIYGKFGSGKSNLAMRLIAEHQRMYPDKTCTWVDAEGTFDENWAKKFGIDIDKLALVYPDYGEQATDIIEAIIHAPDCGLVVLDSLPSMLNIREMEKSAEIRNVGGPAFLVTGLIRKVAVALSVSRKKGGTPTFVGINQIRVNIGTRSHDKESTPGGKALEHAVSLKLRLYSREVKDPKYHKELPVINDTTFMIKKKKFPVVSVKGDFQMALIPHKGLKVGQCDDFNLLKSYMESHGILVKEKNSWVFNEDQEFKTLKDLKAMLLENPDLEHEVKLAIIETEKEKANGEEVIDDETGEVTYE